MPLIIGDIYIVYRNNSAARLCRSEKINLPRSEISTDRSSSLLLGFHGSALSEILFLHLAVAKLDTERTESGAAGVLKNIFGNRCAS